MGIECTSFHKIAQKAYDDLLNDAQDIRNVFEKFTEEDLKNNRLRLMATIFSVRWCAFQVVPFRGHDESSDSINKGNFREMLKAIGFYNNEMKELFRTAPKYALYTSPSIQKEILNLISTRVKQMICKEIDGGKFCLLVDEARDESNKEQMSIVLRYVNKDRVIVERHFGLVHIPDTTSQSLKNGIYYVLSHNNLDFRSIRGQGYDGASNMRALVAASQGVVAVQKFFFTKLSFVINVVSASSKCTDQLRDAQAEQIAYMISIDELEIGRGINQIGTLQRVGDTRWSSHLKSVSSLIKMFSPTCEVLLKIIEEGNGSITWDADSAYEIITTFEFVFVLHLVKEIMEITDLLCQALQRQSQDVCNALKLVASTKELLQKIGARARKEHSDHTLEHHYRVDIFYEAINCQLMELNHRFNDSSMELLQLSATLNPKSVNEPFRSGDVCRLVGKFYPGDFSEQEKLLLKLQLQHYEIDVVKHVNYKLLTSISELCQWLIKTGRVANFNLIYRVASLILTLPVSTTTTERSFSAMNLIKTRLRNKMEDEFLNDSLILYFERELAETINLETIARFQKCKRSTSSTLKWDIYDLEALKSIRIDCIVIACLGLDELFFRLDELFIRLGESQTGRVHMLKENSTSCSYNSASRINREVPEQQPGSFRFSISVANVTSQFSDFGLMQRARPWLVPDIGLMQFPDFSLMQRARPWLVPDFGPMQFSDFGPMQRARPELIPDSGPM
uniref:HAT C-terminal dimerisation domain-containing protein n=1 Tax=Lactuca sativa TaxID=4236 RepID=A0A9R1X0C4_LACSA|nr:hypothetical protein LSAT_V11C800391790 [Lactuca sativa]